MSICNQRRGIFVGTAAIAILTASLLFQPTVLAQTDGLWRSAGQNIKNTRHAVNETIISPDNVDQLVPKWVFETGGDISATPASDSTSIYFPDWAGNLYRVDATTGELLWQRQIKDYTGEDFNLSRVTPAIAGDRIFIGTQMNLFSPNPFARPPAQIIAVSKQTGDSLWTTKIDDHPFSIVTQSPVVHGDAIYVGVSSMEELFAGIIPGYPCCSFRGSLVKLDKNTGEILWKSYTVPEFDTGFSGNAVWGSTPVIDTKRNSVYVTTGNNYSAPDEVVACVEMYGESPMELRDCIEGIEGSSENYFDALVAFDMTTGAVKWHNSVLPYDAWTTACFEIPGIPIDPTNCPTTAGPDYDFGQGPALFTVKQAMGKSVELLGAGQKSGIYWALSPETGDIVWSKQVGPGGETGGLQWGSATDGKRIYVAVSNSNFLPNTLSDGFVVNGGSWAALDAATGEILWETAGEKGPAVPPAFPVTDPIANNMGPVTVANGVVFAGAVDAGGTMYALDAATGEFLWDFVSGGSVNSGAAVVNGTVYWGSGYSIFGGLLGTPNNKLYAFGLPAPMTPKAGSAGDMLAPESLETLLGLPEHFALETNYPNPFNPSTTIQFALPEAAHIQLIVYDMLGREVEVLANGLHEAGIHEVIFDAQGLPSGTYLYRLETPEGSFTRTMLLLK